MSLKIGTTSISDIYKGTTKIDAIYKGTILVYSSAYWLSYGFTYLYNSLVPTTIDSKSVKDKARIKKIYANGVIENQLVKVLRATATASYGITITNNDDGSITISGTENQGTRHYLTIVYPDSSENYIAWSKIVPEHKYLISTNQKTIKFYLNGTGSQFNSFDYDRIATNGTGTSNTDWNLVIEANTTYNNVKVIPQIIDLTQMFGTGNEPIALPDNRIQKILNSGYIANNAGTYKGTDISEFAFSNSICRESDFINKGFTISTNGELASNSNYNATDYIEVKPNTTYKWHRKNNYTGGNTTTRLAEYNSSKVFSVATINSLDDTSAQTITFTTSSTTKYVRLSMRYTDTEVYLSPREIINTSLSFIYQGNGALNSHDTLERLDTEWVFTKNIGNEDLSSLNWTYDSGNSFFASDDLINKIVPPVTTSDKVNAFINVCTTLSYQEFLSQNKPDKAFYCSTAGKLRFTNASLNGDTTLITGTIYYQLATPQVIHIPRKHLGIVDLGSLNWVKTGNHFSTNDIKSTVKIPSNNYQTSNLYCDLYMSEHFNLVYNESSNNSIAIQATPSGSAGALHINDNSKSSLTAQQFAETLQGHYLFYETQDEIADIPFTLDIEAGGTITSDSDVLPNVDFDIKCK